MITVSALNINLKQEEKKKEKSFGRSFLVVVVFFLLVGKKGTGTVLGKMALK